MSATSGVPGLGSRELLALAAVFLLSLPAVTPRVYASDEVQYFAYLRSLWFDRDVSFDNEYRAFYDRGIARTPGFEQTFLGPQTPTGLRENFGTIGSALLWAPFYGAADVTTRLMRAAGSEVPADGYSGPYMAAVAYGSAAYAFAALVLSISAARRLTGAGILAGLAVWFGTPLLFYMYAAPAFAHACSAFAVALFLTVWLHVRDRWTVRGLAALGAATALMAMVREQDALYALGAAADFARHVATDVRHTGTLQHAAGGRRAPGFTAVRGWLAAAAAGLLAFTLAYTPQLLAYWSLNGRLGPSQLVTRKMTWTAPHALEVLASPQHGLFLWTPLAALALVGLAVLWRKPDIGARGSELGARRFASPDRRRIAGCMLLMLALQVYVIGSVESWTVAGAFGQRRFVSATMVMVIGLAALWQAVPHGAPRVATAAVAALAIWWNVGLMALFGAGLMDRQRLHLGQNAYGVFITLPREAPALAYRYFTDRSSFYKARISP